MNSTMVCLILSVTLSSVLQSSSLAQNDVRSVYQDAVKLFEAGDYANALTKLEAIQKVRPNDVYTRSYIARAKAALEENAGRKSQGTLPQQLAAIRIPEVQFSQTPVGDALDFIQAKVGELSQGQTMLNFVFRGTNEQRTNITIDLSLRNAPASEVLHYVGRLGQLRFTFEEFAVVVDAPAVTSELTPSTDAPPTPATSASGPPLSPQPAPTNPAPTTAPSSLAAGGKALEGQLSAIIIPEVQFSQTPVGDALDYIQARVRELSGGNTHVNFVFNGTAEQRQNTLITLNLRNAPASQVLAYVARLGRLSITYEEFAVIISAPSP